MKKESNTAVNSIERLGFNQKERMDKFMRMPEHMALLQKFEVVFSQSVPQFGALKKETAQNDEVELMSSPDDKEFDLSGADELSLSADDEASPTLPVDEGMDLDGEADPLAGLSEPPPVDSTMTGLKLGDALEELDSEVLAKMKEIDAMMEDDATSGNLGELLATGADDDAGLGDMTATEANQEGAADDSALVFGDDSEMGDLFASSDDAPPAQLTEEEPAPDYGEASMVMKLDDELGFNAMEEEELPVASAAPPKPMKLPGKPATTPSPAPVAAAPIEEEELAPLGDVPSFSAEDDDGVAVGFETTKTQIRPPAPPVQTSASATRSGGQLPGQAEYREVVGHYNAELERLQATLNHLRADRESLLKKIDDFEEEKIHHQRLVLGMRAELDEKKIETQLMKKRMGEETQDLKYALQLEQERRQIAEEKVKAVQAEMATVQQKIRMEVRKVSAHERDLQQQLELLRSDAETQIRNRDLKILELKRRLDAMEFDVENMSALEKKTQENKQELEVKLDKAIRTLRAAIGILEVDDPKVTTLEKLKKTLDV